MVLNEKNAHVLPSERSSNRDLYFFLFLDFFRYEIPHKKKLEA